MLHRTPQLVLLLLVANAFGQEEVLDSPPTWHGGVAAIVKENCGVCHQAGGSGPFSLMSYNDVSRRRLFVEHVLEEEIMPPWLPSAGVAVVGDRRLSHAEKTRLLAWIKAGAPEGDPSESAVVKQGRQESVSPMPGPQVQTASMRSPWTVPAEGGKRWFAAERDKRTFVLPLKNASPLRVQAIQYETTAPLALGATALAVDTTGNARRIVDWDEEPGSYMMGDFGFTAAGTLAVLGPGGGRLEIPKGFHIQIPANADLVSEVHFRPQGREWELNDTIRLEEVSPAIESRPLGALNLMVRKLEVDAGETATLEQSMDIPFALDLIALSPRASRRCVWMRLTAEIPGHDEAIVLLEVQDWDPHYRSTLVLEEPMTLPTGTKIRGVWKYDNSAQNPRNPVNPPEDVSLGSRCGVANVLLLCAPVESERLTELEQYAQREVLKAQR